MSKRAKKIIVDIDENELKKPTVVPDLAIHADLKDFFTALDNELLKQIQHDNLFPDFSGWVDWCNVRKEKYAYKLDENKKENELIDPYYFMQALTEVMKENTVLTTANGTANVCYFQSGIVKKGQRIIWNSGDASMGYDLSAAIGACIAQGRKDTICLAGDGSLMMNIQEFQTIKHYDLPIKLFILNNDGYISIKQTQANFFNGRLTACSRNSGVSMPDFIKVAEAFGLKALRIEGQKDLQSKIQGVLDTSGAIVCEVMLEPDYTFSPKLSSRKLEDGTMVSPSLEDMYPFLDRDEFESNIIK